MGVFPQDGPRRAAGGLRLLKSRFCSGDRKEDSVKETQEGCLSRPINDFLERSLFKKPHAAGRKDFFDTLGPRRPAGGFCGSFPENATILTLPGYSE
jgi:hypothetical protein